MVAVAGPDSAGSRLRRLLDAKTMALLPGCHDALGARLIEDAGFGAVYMSGFSVAASFGRPDLGILTMSDVVARSIQIAEAVSIPLLVDADTGYGGPLNIAETVRRLEQGGVGGLHLEDQKTPKKCGALAGKELVTVEEMCARIVIAKRARRGDSFVIVGRTDAVTVAGLEETIRRVKAMAAAGADAIMVPSLETPEQLRAVAQSVTAPVLYVAAETVRPMYDAKQLAEFGFAGSLYPLSLIMASVAVQRHVLKDLLATGNTAQHIPNMTPFREVGALVGTPAAGEEEAALVAGT
jgi:2-methylisocitrate lyase-like PEP mutase family enzyme